MCILCRAFGPWRQARLIGHVFECIKTDSLQGLDEVFALRTLSHIKLQDRFDHIEDLVH